MFWKPILKNLIVLLLSMIVTFGEHKDEKISKKIGERLRYYGTKTYKWAFPTFKAPIKFCKYEKTEEIIPMDYLLDEEIKTEYPELSRERIKSTDIYLKPKRPFNIFYSLLKIPHSIEEKLLFLLYGAIIDLHEGITESEDGQMSIKPYESYNKVELFFSLKYIAIEFCIGRDTDKKDIDNISRELAISLKKSGKVLDNLEDFRGKLNKKEIGKWIRTNTHFT